jgi:hypothetical protein
MDSSDSAMAVRTKNWVRRASVVLMNVRTVTATSTMVPAIRMLGTDASNPRTPRKLSANPTM